MKTFQNHFQTTILLPEVFGEMINFTDINLSDPIFECIPATQNLYQLSLWRDDLVLEFGDLFEGSDLDLFIGGFGDIPEAKCTRISFCQSDFSILGSNIGQIDCDNPPFNCETPSTGIPGPCFSYACIDDNFYGDEPWTISLSGGEIVEFFGHWEQGCESPFPGQFFIVPNDSSGVINKMLSYPAEQAQFVNMGKAISEGECMPKGIVKTGNQYHYVDYAVHSRWDVLQNIPAIIDFVDDWDSEAITLVREAGNSQFALDRFENDQYVWSKILGTNQQISVTYFEQQDSNYAVGGEFQGTLQFNGVTLANENAKSAYVLLIDKSGILLDSKIASDIGLNGKVCFSRKEGGITIAGYSSASTVKVDGEIKIVDNQSIVDISIDKDGLTETKSVFSLDPTLKIIKLVESGDGNYKTYMFQGNGNYIVDNSVYTVLNPNTLVLLTVNSNDELIWHNQVNHAGNLTDGSFDAVYGQKYNLLIGLTFHNSVSIGAHSYISKGSDDILILSFSETGEIMNGVTYGSSDAEKISNLMLCGETLYFGGEFSGSTASRSIGKYDFFATNTFAANPYISLIPLTDLSKIELKTTNRDQKTNNLSETSVRFFPNPVRDILHVGIDSPVSGKVRIRLFDALGNTVISENKMISIGQNTVQINFPSQMPAGIYFTEVVDVEGRQWNERVVKN